MHVTRSNSPRNTPCAFEVARSYVAGQPIESVVRNSDSVIFVLVRNNAKNRPKNLFASNCHIVANTHECRRLYKVTLIDTFRTAGTTGNQKCRLETTVTQPLRLLRPYRTLFLLALGLQTCLDFSGCFRDPNLRKQGFVEEGDQYFAQDKFREALLTYGRAIQIDPRLAAGHYKIAKCHLKLGNWASAFQELQRAIDLEPQNSSAHLDLGQLYLAGGRASEAKDEAKLILQSNAGDLGAQILLSDADGQLGDLKRALREGSDAVTLAPQNATVYLNLAGIQQRSGLFQEAEANLVKAKTLAPGTAIATMALSHLYETQKGWQDAEAEFRRSIDTPKESRPARSARGTVHRRGSTRLS